MKHTYRRFKGDVTEVEDGGQNLKAAQRLVVGKPNVLSPIANRKGQDMVRDGDGWRGEKGDRVEMNDWHREMVNEGDRKMANEGDRKMVGEEDRQERSASYHQGKQQVAGKKREKDGYSEEKQTGRAKRKNTKDKYKSD